MATDIDIDLSEPLLNAVKESMTGLAPKIKQYITEEIKNGTAGTYKAGKINIDLSKSVNKAIKTESKELKGIDLGKLMFMDNKTLSNEMKVFRDLAEENGEALDSKKYLIASRLLEKRNAIAYDESDLERQSDTESYLKTATNVKVPEMYQEFDNIYNEVVGYAKNVLTGFSTKDISNLSVEQLNPFLDEANNLSWITNYGEDNKNLYYDVIDKFSDAQDFREQSALKTIENVSSLFESGKESNLSLNDLNSQLTLLKSAKSDLKATGYDYKKEISDIEALIDRSNELIKIREQSVKKSSKQESAKKESVEQDAIKNEEIKQESAKKEASKQKTTKKKDSEQIVTSENKNGATTRSDADSKTVQTAKQTSDAVKKEGEASEQATSQFSALASAKNEVATKNKEVAQTADNTTTNLKSEGDTSKQTASDMTKINDAVKGNMSNKQEEGLVRSDVKTLAKIRSDIATQKGKIDTLALTGDSEHESDAISDYIKKKEAEADNLEANLGILNKYESEYLESKVTDAELGSDVSYAKVLDRQDKEYLKQIETDTKTRVKAEEQAQKILDNSRKNLLDAQSNNPNAKIGNTSKLKNQIEAFEPSTSKDPIAEAKKYSDSVISETKRMESEQANYNKNFNEYVTARSNIIKLNEQRKSVSKDSEEYKELTKQIDEQKAVRDEAKKQIGVLSKEQHNQIDSNEKALKNRYNLKSAQKTDSQNKADIESRNKLEEQANAIVEKAKKQIEESVSKTPNVKDGKTNGLLSSLQNFNASTSKDPVAKANSISNNVSAEIERRSKEQGEYNNKVKEYVELQKKIKSLSLEKSTATDGSEYFKALDSELSNLIKQSDALKKSLGEIPTSALNEINKTNTELETSFNKKQAKKADTEIQRQTAKSTVETGTSANTEQIKKYSELASQSSNFYQNLFSMQQKSVSNMSTEIAQLDELVTEYQKVSNLKGDYSSLINTNGTKSSQSRVESSVDKFVNNMDISNGQDLLYSNLLSIVQRQLNFTDDSVYVDSFITKVNDSITKTEELKKQIASVDDIDGFKNVTSQLIEYSSEVKKLLSDASSNKIASSTQTANLQQAISRTLSQNTAMSSDMKNSYQTILNQVTDSSKQLSTGQIKDLNSEFLKLNSTLYMTGQTGLSFFDTFSSSLSTMNTQLIAQFFSIQAFINYGKKAFSIINEIDTAMTELKRVTDLTDYGYTQMFQDATEAAQEYGREISNIINASADWVQLGFSSNEAIGLAGVSAMYQNVTDLDEDTAVDNLVTAYKGFEEQLLEANNNDKTQAITNIADVYDKMGSEFAHEKLYRLKSRDG